MDSVPYEIRWIDEKKGKGMFATRPIKNFEVILEEKPLICCQFAWNAEYGYSACDNCLAPLETAEENARRLTGNPSIVLPNPECCKTKKELITECADCGVKYCSMECKDEAYERYHRTLCLQTKEKNDSHPLVRLNEVWKQMHYPPEAASIMLLARMVALVNQSKDKQEMLSVFSKFCHRTETGRDGIVHKLLDNKFSNDIDLLREMMQKSLNTEYMENWFTSDGFKNLLALIGTNGQGIGTTAFGRWVNNFYDLEKSVDLGEEDIVAELYRQMNNHVGVFLDNEGSGLYILQSSVNHSCLPNAVVEFPYSNSTLVLRPKSDIAVGEEICISYLDECSLRRSLHFRQLALKSSYLFSCTCVRCSTSTCDLSSSSEEEEEEIEDEVSWS